jgi:hypothetical protein
MKMGKRSPRCSRLDEEIRSVNSAAKSPDGTHVAHLLLILRIADSDEDRAA